MAGRLKNKHELVKFLSKVNQCMYASTYLATCVPIIWPPTGMLLAKSL